MCAFVLGKSNSVSFGELWQERCWEIMGVRLHASGVLRLQSSLLLGGNEPHSLWPIISSMACAVWQQLHATIAQSNNFVN